MSLTEQQIKTEHLNIFLLESL